MVVNMLRGELGDRLLVLNLNDVFIDLDDFLSTVGAILMSPMRITAGL